MDPKMLGIIIGGLVPAIIFGINGIFNKLAVQSGLTVGTLLLFTGIGVACASIPFLILDPALAINGKGVLFGTLNGFLWGLGTGCLAFALLSYKTPLSVLAPLYNMNTLVVVLLSLWIFAEWQQVNVIKLLIGALMVVIGGTLVALA